MSEGVFRGFGQFSRPDIGLISDGFQNLSEIFESDKRNALRNILLDPESLDQIYQLSETISREDLRSVSGLSSFLLSTLHRIDNISGDRILEELEVDKLYASPKYTLGGTGSNALNRPNVIIFNGGIKCEGAFYRANVLSESLFENPEKRLISLSTSRSSLFSSNLDEDNPGFFKDASYPGSVRVRRKSHVNRIFVPEGSFVRKSSVPESPSHTLKLNVINGPGQPVTPLKLLATINSPLKIFCRLSRGSIKFKFTDSLINFYGYQVQVVQQRPNTEFVDFLQLEPSSQPSGTNEFTLDIDITSTGYQLVYDLYLYLYLNPEKVRGLEFEGIDIRETPDKKDLGLIGFNNLEELRVSGGSMTILPLWLKTLSNKLRVLDLKNSGDTWKSGPMSWFDIRNSGAVPSFNHPIYTVVSYLTIPKSGPMINSAGDDWADEKFEKYILNESRTAGVDYRQFTNLQELYLGDRFRGLNSDLSDVFPNLRVLEWNTKTRGLTAFISGQKLPSIKNTGGLTQYNISGSGASGTIYDIGTSTNPSDPGYISNYRMTSFNISGFSDRRHNITGFIGNPAEDWSNWYLNSTFINISDTGTTINIQNNTWKSLRELLAVQCANSLNISNPSAPLRTPALRSIDLDGSILGGQMFSLGDSSTENTGELTSIGLYNSRQITPVVKNGIDYFLPENFAPERASGSPHKLLTLSVPFIQQQFRFREKDLINLRELTYFGTFNSRFTGRFPTISARPNPELNTKVLSVVTQFSNFYDLMSLSITPINPLFSRDLAYLDCNGQNASGGGALLPSFEGVVDSQISIVILDSSLRSTYPSNWFLPQSRGAAIRNNDSYTEISGLSISRVIQTPGNAWEEKDNIYTITGASNFNTKVLVNDIIKGAVNGPEIARVLSVSSTEIIIDRDIPNTLPSTLYFFRNTVNITNWFSSGFSKLVTFRAKNCRLSGSLNILPGFSSVVFLDLSENNITSYVPGCLFKVFLGNSRNITVNLSYNNLSIEAIGAIISDVIQINLIGRFRNCFVRVGFNKLDSDGKYINYSQSEIFPTQVRKGGDIITSLFRDEEFYVYETVNQFDENGNQVQVENIVGTRIVQIPGELIQGVYYKTRINETQVTVESAQAIAFKNLFGVRVDLGFAYISPVTTPIITLVRYEDVTTRYQSIIDAGLDPEDLVNP